MNGICLYLLLLSLFCQLVWSAGILYPQESETRELKSLDGLWKLRTTPQDNPEAGFKNRWYTTHLKEWLFMAVPSSYNDVTVHTELRDYVGWVWYQRNFYPPQRWEKDNQRVLIRFGSVCYTAKVFVNGIMVVEHSGGHLPFQAELTKILKYGAPNLITVAVNNTLTLQTIPQGTVQHTNDTSRYPPGFVINSYNFDFFNYAGIHRSIHLYTTPAVYVDDVTILTQVEENRGVIQYHISYIEESNSLPMLVDCEVTLLEASDVVVASNKGCQGKLNIEEVKLWWPIYMSSNPGFQYVFKVQLVDNFSSVLDVYSLPVGVRTINWDGGLFINNRPVYLRGMGRHEDSNIRGKGLDYALLVKDHSLISWLSANAYRTSHYPYSEEDLNMADEKGLLVIDECPAVNLDDFSDVLLEKHKAVLGELIQRDKNRASIVMWSLANEARTQRKEAGPHFKAVAEHVRTLDTSRPITIVTNQHYSVDQAAQYMDIIGVNKYNAWYEDTGALDLIQNQVEVEFEAWHKFFNKSVFMSEYGADAISGIHKLPSFVWSEDYQRDLLQHHFKAFNNLCTKNFFIGEMIWNFADFATQQGYLRVDGNHKGIFTREREPKEAAYILRTRYRELAQLVDNYLWH